jgi:hypothetical protein
MAGRTRTATRRGAAHGEEFSIRAERRGPTHRITAAGDMGSRGSFRLHDEFYRALPTDATTIVVDLSAVTAVNRAAINTLTFMRRRSAGRLRIIPSPAVASAVHALAAEAGRSEEEPG